MNRRVPSALLILRTSLVTAVASAREIARAFRHLKFDLCDRAVM
jgi:hypothetical protein